MNKNKENIFPVGTRVSKSEKEKLIQQKSKVIWFTGLSGSGKTTLARQVELHLFQKGFLSQILDGDNIRSGINNNLRFTDEDRYENIRRIAEVSRLFLNCGIITLNSFISPTDKIRKMAIDIIGEENFIEVFVNAPLSVCEERDVKGLYAKARKGEIINFTGIDSLFEEPHSPHIEVKTDVQSVEESVNQIVDYILPQITI